MKPHTPSPKAIEPVPCPEPVPPEDRLVEPVDSALEEQEMLGIPRAFRSGRQLILENEPTIPARICIKSGRPTYREIEISLRDPKNPKTWFGKRPKLHVGLCRKAIDDYRVAVTLTWSFLGIGVLMLVAGIFSGSILTCLVGVMAMAVSGIFRATSPVTSPDATEQSATVIGVARSYLEQFEEVPEPTVE